MQSVNLFLLQSFNKCALSNILRFFPLQDIYILNITFIFFELRNINSAENCKCKCRMYKNLAEWVQCILNKNFMLL